jgi:hypothetical protein
MLEYGRVLARMTDTTVPGRTWPEDPMTKRTTRSRSTSKTPARKAAPKSAAVEGAIGDGGRWYATDGTRLTDCCGAYSKVMMDWLCCRKCKREVPLGLGDGSEHAPWAASEKECHVDEKLRAELAEGMWDDRFDEAVCEIARERGMDYLIGNVEGLFTILGRHFKDEALARVAAKESDGCPG